MTNIQSMNIKNYKRRVTYQKLNSIFSDLDYELILNEDDFNNSGSVMNLDLRFICNEHPQLGIQSTNYEKIRKGNRQCTHCISQHYSNLKKGSNSANWNGGKTKLNNYLRNVIVDWKYESQKSCGFQCVITGETNQKKLKIWLCNCIINTH